MSSYNMADGAVHASSATTAHDAKGSYQGFATNPSTSRVSTPADQGRTFESERQARSNKQPFHQMVHGCEAVRIQTRNTCTPSASNNLPVRVRQSLPLHRDLKPCADSDESDDSIVFISSSQHANSPTTPTATGQPPLQPRQSAPSSSTAPETYRTAQNGPAASVSARAASYGTSYGQDPTYVVPASAGLSLVSPELRPASWLQEGGATQVQAPREAARALSGPSHPAQRSSATRSVIPEALRSTTVSQPSVVGVNPASAFHPGVAARATSAADSGPRETMPLPPSAVASTSDETLLPAAHGSSATTALPTIEPAGSTPHQAAMFTATRTAPPARQAAQASTHQTPSTSAAVQPKTQVNPARNAAFIPKRNHSATRQAGRPNVKRLSTPQLSHEARAEDMGALPHAGNAQVSEASNAAHSPNTHSGAVRPPDISRGSPPPVQSSRPSHAQTTHNPQRPPAALAAGEPRQPAQPESSTWRPQAPTSSTHVSGRTEAVTSKARTPPAGSISRSSMRSASTAQATVSSLPCPDPVQSPKPFLLVQKTGQAPFSTHSTAPKASCAPSTHTGSTRSSKSVASQASADPRSQPTTALEPGAPSAPPDPRMRPTEPELTALSRSSYTRRWPIAPAKSDASPPVDLRRRPSAPLKRAASPPLGPRKRGPVTNGANQNDWARSESTASTAPADPRVRSAEPKPATALTSGSTGAASKQIASPSPADIRMPSTVPPQTDSLPSFADPRMRVLASRPTTPSSSQIDGVRGSSAAFPHLADPRELPAPPKPAVPLQHSDAATEAAAATDAADPRVRPMQSQQAAASSTQKAGTVPKHGALPPPADPRGQLATSKLSTSVPLPASHLQSTVANAATVSGSVRSSAAGPALDNQVNWSGQTFADMLRTGKPKSNSHQTGSRMSPAEARIVHNPLPLSSSHDESFRVVHPAPAPVTQPSSAATAAQPSQFAAPQPDQPIRWNSSHSTSDPEDGLVFRSDTSAGTAAASTLSWSDVFMPSAGKFTIDSAFPPVVDKPQALPPVAYTEENADTTPRVGSFFVPQPKPESKVPVLQLPEGFDQHALIEGLEPGDDLDLVLKGKGDEDSAVYSFCPDALHPGRNGAPWPLAAAQTLYSQSSLTAQHLIIDRLKESPHVPLFLRLGLKHVIEGLAPVEGARLRTKTDWIFDLGPYYSGMNASDVDGADDEVLLTLHVRGAKTRYTLVRADPLVSHLVLNDLRLSPWYDADGHLLNQLGEPVDDGEINFFPARIGSLWSKYSQNFRSETVALARRAKARSLYKGQKDALRQHQDRQRASWSDLRRLQRQTVQTQARHDQAAQELSAVQEEKLTLPSKHTAELDALGRAHAAAMTAEREEGQALQRQIVALQTQTARAAEEVRRTAALAVYEQHSRRLLGEDVDRRSKEHQRAREQDVARAQDILRDPNASEDDQVRARLLLRAVDMSSAEGPAGAGTAASVEQDEPMTVDDELAELAAEAEAMA